ncbi:MAG: dihydropteroate synthase, partial [Betaproteobacteria bacterium]
MTAAPSTCLAPPPMLHAGRFSLSLERTLIMGIVNVTPDSFSDGGRYFDAAHAVEHATRLVEEGADLIDIGAESSRPGAEPIGADEELQRLLPVLEKLVELPVPVSVDTCKPEVMRRAIAAGATMINDILALQAPGALDLVASSNTAVCLMHMQGTPRTMQRAPHYVDVVGEVQAFLAAR